MSRLRSGSLRCLLAAVVAVVLLPRSAHGPGRDRARFPGRSSIRRARSFLAPRSPSPTRRPTTRASRSPTPEGISWSPTCSRASTRVRIALQSFRTLERKNIVLSAGERLAVPNLTLEVGSVGETVTVESRGTHVNTAETQHSGLITSKQIEQIQVLGRDVTSIMRLLPGVRYENTVDSLGMSFGTDVPNVGGARRDWSNVITDGVVANEVGNSDLMAQQINLDAIAEVRVLLNSYRAEYGRAGGGQVQIVSKSGHLELPRQPLRLRPPRSVQRQQLLQQPIEHQEAALSLQHLRRQPRRARSRA